GTNYVWVFADAEVGPRVGPTPQFNDMGTMISATGTSAGTTLTVADTSAIAAGDQVNGAGIPAGTTVDTVDSSTALTLSAALTSNVSGNVTIYTERIGATSGLQELCDGTTPYIAGGTGVLTLGDASASPSTARNNAGVYVNGTSASSVSFDIYVPTNGGRSGSTENFIALGIVVDAGGDGILDDTTGDTAIFTHVVSKPWESSDLVLAACSSPSATADPCIDVSATGIFQSDGTTRIGTDSQFSASASVISGSGESIVNVSLGFTAAVGNGFAIPANSIVKGSISLPTSGTISGVDFGAARFTDATGQTGLLIDPQSTSSSSHTNRWDFTTASDRDIISFAGQARATSTAVSRSTWYSECQINFSGSSVSTVGCGEGMTSSISSGYLVFTTTPGEMSLAVLDSSLAGGLVSTNAQNMNFGPETMTGTSFQFAVAGPSYNSSDASRSSDGFYYVCVPEAFLTGSFGTTSTAAASEWIGTRDGATIATSFATGTCGASTGLVAYLDPFGYSAPVFSLRPPTVASVPAPATDTSTGTSSTSTTSPTTSPTTEVSVITVPAVAPTRTTVYPLFTVGKTVKPAYISKLAGIKKNARVRISVPKMFRKVCSVRAGKVIALSTGTCGVRVVTTTPKGKKISTRVYLDVHV
ncbi:MAG: hypothetical protein K9G69_01570, partial [Candidatus Nanopelagicales bacterium]|nr:hypothetical protein [Candidatus Nanopelagicales bacterium]